MHNFLVYIRGVNLTRRSNPLGKFDCRMSWPAWLRQRNAPWPDSIETSACWPLGSLDCFHWPAMIDPSRIVITASAPVIISSTMRSALWMIRQQT